eukprot:TRINITY_DN19407_c0_g1_i1.p1 TRINITY_DN19407_c0_g1~~TRINITY_DN19407_c0_g1_i1.p1  ORF type:complete len:109 (+),score=5.80 TRINITY_DN19407_c0_g1_i1:55-381(+)
MGWTRIGLGELPERYGWTKSGSFGAFTVAKRFPKIAAELEGDPDLVRSLCDWMSGLESYRIDPGDFVGVALCLPPSDNRPERMADCRGSAEDSDQSSTSNSSDLVERA